MTEIQNRFGFWILDFDIVWNLGFGIWDLFFQYSTFLKENNPADLPLKGGG